MPCMGLLLLSSIFCSTYAGHVGTRKPMPSAEREEDNCTCWDLCRTGYGNCETSWDCYYDHTCGVNNCVDFDENAQPESDCCFRRPDKCDGSFGLEHCCLDSQGEKC